MTTTNQPRNVKAVFVEADGKRSASKNSGWFKNERNPDGTWENTGLFTQNREIAEGWEDGGAETSELEL